MRLTTTFCPNVGLLLDSLQTGYQRDIIDGVQRAAGQRGANVWVFVGGLFANEALDHEDNVVYRMAKRPAIDGVVAGMSTLINRIGKEKGQRILSGLGVPTVSLGLLIDQVTSLGVNNKSGLVQLCEHLVRDHGYRNFAMIAGPVHNVESQERIAACRETLGRFGIELGDDRVTSQGYLNKSGTDGVEELFDKRKFGKESIQAILCANDLIAEGALRALAERSIAVPEQIAITGFDDLDRAKYLIPSLTTVRQPVVELAYASTRSLLQKLDGNDVPLEEVLPSTFVPRGSCGCSSSATAAPRAGLAGRGGRHGASRSASRIADRRELICAGLSRAAQGRFKAAGPDWESRWMMALLADLGSFGGKGFLALLDSTLRGVAHMRAELELCLEVLGAFREELLTDIDDVQVIRRVEDIMHAARLMGSTTLERLEVNRRLVTSEALYGALYALERLTRQVGQTDFWNHLERELRDLRIHTCFVTRYAEGYERSTFFWGFSENESVTEQLLGQNFPSGMLLPSGLASRTREYAVIVRSLVFNGRVLGTAFMSLSAADIASYEPLIAVMALALARG